MEEEDSRTETADRYRCGWEGCQQQLTTQQQLVGHVTSQHVQLASSSYRCLWRGCSRRRQGFNARYKMFVHIRTHTKERPHVCADCGKGFSRQENLKIHKRSHTGEKPYACTFEGCERAYSNSSDRFKHTRTHYVDRPYACRRPGCSKSYTDPSSLRKHMKANGHGRATSPATTPPPAGRTEKLSRTQRPPAALESETAAAASVADAPSPAAPEAAGVSLVSGVPGMVPGVPGMVPGVPGMVPGVPGMVSGVPGPARTDCGGCGCGRTAAPPGWGSWLWYNPWMPPMNHLWPGCPAAMFEPLAEGRPGSAESAGSAALVSQPTASPAPLDLRVPPS